MGDNQLMHAAPAMYNGGGGGGAVSHGMWWNSNAAAGAVPAAACSTELAGFNTWPAGLSAGGYDVAAADGGKQAKSCTTTASSESPGNNSSITFQETASINDPAAAGFADWNNPYMSSGAGNNMHGFLQVGHHDMSSRADQQSMMNAVAAAPNNLDLALQGHQQHHHHQQQDDHQRQQQLLSSLGAPELLLSPNSPYGFQSSLLRSLIEPTGKPAPAAGLLQQYQYQQMGGQTGAREPLQFTNNDAAFWNQSAGFGMGMPAPPASDNAGVRAAKQASPAPRGANLALKTVLEGVGDSSSIVAKKASGEPAFKKPRTEMPSPLPTFKVRKEKLGDRITALQQLVSPFGKTDTASVLHETIEYIKFLHDQVGVLSAPYLKSGHHQHQVPQYLKSSSNGSPDKSCKDGGEVSLKGRGLCLVPISSTFAVASDVPVDFWTPFAPQFR
ncbi:transcription factor bHLH112-like [Hordeum vulgare subsp. vulgare]|uniref:BHLH domain-containing protein n=1 Tax=Hordeum vulgare subsp. vulgare TaxID=112509 RepID=A0A8I6X8J2_HORVV|nr:transcription factor bHLH112-like [Hordeum vulgare subsp. vulgare]